MCSETGRDVMAASLCNGDVSNFLTAGMGAEWSSMHERLIIFQSVSKNIALQLKEELKRKMWGSLGADGEALLNNDGEQYRFELQENADALRPMFTRSCRCSSRAPWSGGAGLGKTYIVNAARCEAASILVHRHL